MSTIKNAVKLEGSECRKNEAFNAVRMLINNKDDAEAKEILYNYFLPAIKKVKPLEPLLWLKLAISKVNDVRECLSYIYVEDGYAMASDGSVAHVIKCSMGNGYYDPDTLNLVAYDDKYPNSMLGYKGAKCYFKVSMRDFRMEVSNADNIKDVYRTVIYMGNSYKYEHVVNAFGGREFANVGCNEGLLIIEGGCTDGIAVIAPIF